MDKNGKPVATLDTGDGDKDLMWDVSQDLMVCMLGFTLRPFLYMGFYFCSMKTCKMWDSFYHFIILTSFAGDCLLQTLYARDIRNHVIK